MDSSREPTLIGACPPAEDLAAFVTGNLAGTRFDDVAQHISRCGDCVESLTQLSDAGDTLIDELRKPAGVFAGTQEDRRRVVELANAVGCNARAVDSAEAAAPAGDRETTTAVDASLDDEGDSDRVDLNHLGPYRITAKLGEGGMGAVYQAVHTRLEKVVAIKVLRTPGLQSASVVSRFEREMRAVGKLDHPHIVRATDADEDDGVHYLVMEYIDGVDLSKVARAHGQLPVAAACELIRQAAFGLQHAHEHGLVHRDIKPSNLMLTGRGQVKILDMGLALLDESHLPLADELTGTGQVMGTLDYMAPEQGADTHQVDIRADIYSLGATLYKLLAGVAPFAGEQYDTPIKKIRALATETVPAIDTYRHDLPSELVGIVSRMLSGDPSSRFASPLEVARALQPFCRGADLAALLKPLGVHAAAENSHDACAAGTESFLDSDSTGRVFKPTSGKDNEGKRVSAVTVSSVASSGKRLLIAVSTAAVLLLLTSGIVTYIRSPDGGTVRIELLDPQLELHIKDEQIHIQGKKSKAIILKPGRKTLTIKRGDFQFETDTFVLREDDGEVQLSVEYVAGTLRLMHGGRVLDEAQVPELSSQPAGPPIAPPRATAPFDEDVAKEHQLAWADYLGVSVEREIALPDGVELAMVLIPPGNFVMGATSADMEECMRYARTTKQEWFEYTFENQAPAHRVQLTRPYFLSIYEITQRQYEAVMGSNPSYYSTSGEGAHQVDAASTAAFPVDSVSWFDAADFCNALSELQGLRPRYKLEDSKIELIKGEGYRLPTEAQWEFACRAGSKDRYGHGGVWTLNDYSWNSTNAGGHPHAVGTKLPNGFGLFDMLGNQFEWCEDPYARGYYRKFIGRVAIDTLGSEKTDPPRMRVHRGGAFNWAPICNTATFRHPEAPEAKRPGFRVMRFADAVRDSPIPKSE